MSILWKEEVIRFGGKYPNGSTTEAEEVLRLDSALTRHYLERKEEPGPDPPSRK